MARFFFLLATGIVLTAAAPPKALPRKLPPIDQCTGDPGLAKFRAALEQAAKRQDGLALLAMFAPGTEKPSSYRQPDSDAPNDNLALEDWILLRIILRAGCARWEKARVIPSAPMQLERYSDKWLENKVLLLAGEKLYRVPYEEESIRATLGWEVATAVSTGGDFWTGVRLPDGREGWVTDDALYWLTSHAWIAIEKRDGKWMITHFW